VTRLRAGSVRSKILFSSPHHRGCFFILVQVIAIWGRVVLEKLVVREVTKKCTLWNSEVLCCFHICSLSGAHNFFHHSSATYLMNIVRHRTGLGKLEQFFCLSSVTGRKPFYCCSIMGIRIIFLSYCRHHHQRHRRFHLLLLQLVVDQVICDCFSLGGDPS
jgi:hypothetical protein